MLTILLSGVLLLAPADAAPPVADTPPQATEAAPEAPGRASRVVAAALGWRALPTVLPAGLLLGSVFNLVVVPGLALGATVGVLVALDEMKALGDPQFIGVFGPVLGGGLAVIAACTGILAVATVLGAALTTGLLLPVILQE